MAFQGSLREFSATEILQLVGSQKKSGAVVLESGDASMHVHVLEGRIISTRTGGASPDDPLLRFLKRVRRLNDEQIQSVLRIHRESKRDLEDILVNGGYVDAEELSAFIERQSLQDLTDLCEWSEGSYRFDPDVRWEQPPLMRLSAEAALMEAARRADERHRCRDRFKDPQEIPGVRDMPNPDVDIAPDETELFSVIDGRRTVPEVVAEACLADDEAYDALQRMIEAGWVEIVGRREGGASPPPRSAASSRGARARLKVSPFRELAVAVLVIAVLVGMRVTGTAFSAASRAPTEDPVFAAAQIRDVRFALELYRRERGAYPEALDALVQERWLEPAQILFEGRPLQYRPVPERDDYDLRLPDGR
jgi:hypothetical protein